MIQLTRLNNQELILNCDLIKFIEHAHDTVVTLLNGEKLTVQEIPEEILRRVVQWRREEAYGAESAVHRAARLVNLEFPAVAAEVQHG